MSLKRESLRFGRKKPNKSFKDSIKVRFDLASIPNYIGPYETIKKLKDANNSKVYLGSSKYTGEKVIIKAIKKDTLNELNDLILISKQIQNLKILKHRNIVSLYEVYESPKYFYLVTEYLSGKDLIEKIILKKRINEEDAQRIFYQLLDALIYMHKMNICHRNIRTEHILFDLNNRPKLIGFSYSTLYEKDTNISGMFGSLCYSCPEIIQDEEYSPELADVWSLGIVLYVMICGYLPFSDENEEKNKNLILNGKVDYPKEISNKLKDLLRHMLDINPNKRYNFNKILKHPWLKNYNEKFMSGGCNMCKMIYPVDEKIINIMAEYYNFDKNIVENDLKNNKYNIGTGLYKHLLRKILDMKLTSVSDLDSIEFNKYKEDKNNYYSDKEAEEKFKEFIKKSNNQIDKLRQKINDIISQQNYVLERLDLMKEKAIAENEINEDDNENDNENDDNNESNIHNNNDNINENNIDNNNDNIIENNDENKNENNNENNNDNGNNDEKKEETEEKPKTISKKKTMIRSVTPMYKLKKFTKVTKETNENKNTEKIEEAPEDIDIIQQFRDEQNKKMFSNLEEIEKELSLNTRRIKKSNSMEFLNKKINIDVDNLDSPEIVSITPKNSHKFLHKFYPNKFSINSNRKSYLDRGSNIDDYLKRNHPDNLRKTLLDQTSIKSSADEGEWGNTIYETLSEEANDEDEDSNKKQDRLSRLSKLKKSLKYSISFLEGVEDEEEPEESEEESEQSYVSKSDLMFENEIKEALKELKEMNKSNDKSKKKDLINSIRSTIRFFKQKSNANEVKNSINEEKNEDDEYDIEKKNDIMIIGKKNNNNIVKNEENITKFYIDNIKISKKIYHIDDNYTYVINNIENRRKKIDCFYYNNDKIICNKIQNNNENNTQNNSFEFIETKRIQTQNRKSKGKENKKISNSKNNSRKNTPKKKEKSNNLIFVHENNINITNNKERIPKSRNILPQSSKNKLDKTNDKFNQTVNSRSFRRTKCLIPNNYKMNNTKALQIKFRTPRRNNINNEIKHKKNISFDKKISKTITKKRKVLEKSPESNNTIKNDSDSSIDSIGGLTEDILCKTDKLTRISLNKK